MQIYAATSNPGKLREFAGSASGEGIEVLALPDLATMPEPAEDAPDFAGNAQLKAIAYSRLAPGLLVLADDSGLEVDALNGQPGVRSARFADDLAFEPHSSEGKDNRNNRCLLFLLHDRFPATEDGTRPRARFVCELALARDGEVLRRSRGTVEGEILPAPRGASGFGYDPLFFLPAQGKSMAELQPEAKWSVSHRGNAFRSLLDTLRNRDSVPCKEIAQGER